MRKLLRIVLQCLECRKDMFIPETSTRIFCSLSCYWKWMVGRPNEAVSRSRRGKLNPHHSQMMLGNHCHKGFKLTDLQKHNISIKTKRGMKSEKALAGCRRGAYALLESRKFGYRFHRKDLKFPVRSLYEANFCRILNFINLPFEYESKRFKLSTGKTYIPDVYFPIQDLILEIKPGKDFNLSKPLQLRIDYPKLNIKILDKEGYNKLEKGFSSVIPNWEYYKKTKEVKT